MELEKNGQTRRLFRIGLGEGFDTCSGCGVTARQSVILGGESFSLAQRYWSSEFVGDGPFPPDGLANLGTLRLAFYLLRTQFLGPI